MFLPSLSRFLRECLIPAHWPFHSRKTKNIDKLEHRFALPYEELLSNDHLCGWKYSTNSLCGFGQATDTSAQEHEYRPNTLMIVPNDVGFSDISLFGNEISTPNISNLTKDGQLGTNFHVLPACSPTRSELLTGVDNHLNGLGTMFETKTPNQA
jgi:hypothetical protein